MAFCNIQIGGSVFTHEETRSKNFTAKVVPAGVDTSGWTPADYTLAWADAHEEMYSEIIGWLESLRIETVRADQLKVRMAMERRAAAKADAEHLKEHGSRPEAPLAATGSAIVVKTPAQAAGLIALGEDEDVPF